jgi:hypothetical protein
MSRRPETQTPLPRTWTGSLPLERDFADWRLFELDYVWREAEAEATLAYAAWNEQLSLDSYTCFLAAQDRADAAQDALAAEFLRVKRVS